MLISIYVLFFVVQFFNSSKGYYTSLPLTVTQAQSADGQSTHQKNYCKTDNSKQSNLRLNKRFYPEAIVSLAYNYVPVAISHLAKYNPPKPEDYLLISSILTDSLRGPPSFIG